MRKNILLLVLIAINVTLALQIWRQRQLASSREHAAEVARASAEAEREQLIGRHADLKREHDALSANLKQLDAIAAVPAIPSWEKRPEVIKARRGDMEPTVRRTYRLLLAHFAEQPQLKSMLFDALLNRFQQAPRTESPASAREAADQAFLQQVDAILPPEEATLAKDIVIEHPDAWAQVAEIDLALRYVGRPLSSSELRRFADRFKEAAVPTPTSSQELEGAMEKVAAVNAKIVDEARPVMTPAQVSRLEAELKDNAAERRVELYRKMQSVTDTNNVAAGN